MLSLGEAEKRDVLKVVRHSGKRLRKSTTTCALSQRSWFKKRDSLEYESILCTSK